MIIVVSYAYQLLSDGIVYNWRSHIITPSRSSSAHLRFPRVFWISITSSSSPPSLPTQRRQQSANYIRTYIVVELFLEVNLRGNLGGDASGEEGVQKLHGWQGAGVAWSKSKWNGKWRWRENEIFGDATPRPNFDVQTSNKIVWIDRVCLLAGEISVRSEAKQDFCGLHWFRSNRESSLELDSKMARAQEPNSSVCNAANGQTSDMLWRTDNWLNSLAILRLSVTDCRRRERWRGTLPTYSKCNQTKEQKREQKNSVTVSVDAVIV